MVDNKLYTQAVIELDRFILDVLLQRLNVRIDENSIHKFISRLVSGDTFQVLRQERREITPDFSFLGHRKLDLEELLEVHQRSLSRKSPFSIMPTCRYTPVPEASVVALDCINAKVIIPELTGFLVSSSNSIIKKLEAEGKTNSVVEWRGSSHLLIGPVSSINHDCNPNSEFSLQSKVRGQARTVRVITKRHILHGEEITVSYSNHYFGKKNKDCLCLTCEAAHHNGWGSTVCTVLPFPEQNGGRVTRKIAEQRKLEALGQMIYSYRALNYGVTERRGQDYQDLIPVPDINCCNVCKMRVAYSYICHLCASCRLRAALRDHITQAAELSRN